MKGARLLLIALLGFAAARTGAATAYVIWDESGFSPSTVTIDSGDTVEWSNADFFFPVEIESDASFGDPDYFSILLFDGDYEDRVFTYDGSPGSTKSIPYHSNWSDSGTIVVRAPSSAASIVLTEP